MVNPKIFWCPFNSRLIAKFQWSRLGIKRISYCYDTISLDECAYQTHLGHLKCKSHSLIGASLPVIYTSTILTSLEIPFKIQIYRITQTRFVEKSVKSKSTIHQGKHKFIGRMKTMQCCNSNNEKSYCVYMVCYDYHPGLSFWTYYSLHPGRYSARYTITMSTELPASLCHNETCRYRILCKDGSN